MTKAGLYLAILVSGILLGFLHFKIKPRPDSRSLNQTTRDFNEPTRWMGRFPPDFELVTTRGERFKLSENIGKKVIVLNFFATWCGPCRREMPELNRYFSEHKDQPFLLIGIDSEESQERVQDFLNDLGVDFPTVIDSGPLQRDYHVDSFPTTVLIGVDGKIQLYEVGALSNADVAFDESLKKGRDTLQAGHGVTAADYLQALAKQPPLASAPQPGQAVAPKDELDERGKRIALQMDCSCGCDKKVQVCTCKTSSNIKHALATENFGKESDAEIMTGLNKRFCMGGM
jgi:thiol-disulfide isomerase/thioredoxin